MIHTEQYMAGIYLMERFTQAGRLMWIDIWLDGQLRHTAYSTDL
jgi:hypothetical protein